MRKYIFSLLAIILFCVYSCSNEKEYVEYTPNEVQINIETKSGELNVYRVFIFDLSETLIEERVFTSAPIRLRAPVGKFHFVVLASSSTLNTPIFNVGATKMSDVMLSISKSNGSAYFNGGAETFYYVTPQPVLLNELQSFDISLTRTEGLLSFNVKAKSDMTDIWARIVSPVKSINFLLQPKQQDVKEFIRCKLEKDPISGNFIGDVAAFSQSGAEVEYEVVYQQGLSQIYKISLPINIQAGIKTTVNSEFSSTLSSIITYDSWDASYDIDYVAGFQVKVNVDGGQPMNYTGLTVKVKNTATNVITQLDSIPTRIENGYLMFNSAQFLGNGNYKLIYAKLHDRDGKLEDPNNRGTSLLISFKLPGRVPSLTLDGRQNEEEYFVRKVIKTMHGSLVEGSVYPGLTVYTTTRCVPQSLPTEQEGTIVNEWIIPSVAGGQDYYMSRKVISSEWRMYGFYFKTYQDAFDQTDIIDTRFLAGGGRMPISDFQKLLYTNTVHYGRIDFSYGNDLSQFANVKRLRDIYIINHDITNSNKFSGSLPAVLSKLDITDFEMDGTNMSSTLPSEYGNWKNLNKIHLLVNSGLTGSVPSTYSNFLQATLFRIAQTNISGKLPQSFEVYANMNVGFNLNSNKLTCVPPNFLSRYTTNVAVQQGGSIGACTYP